MINIQVNKTTGQIKRMKEILLVLLVLGLLACQQEVNESPDLSSSGDALESNLQQLIERGYQAIEYYDETTKDTVIMQQYYIAFLKGGSRKPKDRIEGDSLQRLHEAYMGKMVHDGYASMAGPFEGKGKFRGMTIFNTPNVLVADSLMNNDPKVLAGILEIEWRPWWAPKGFQIK